MRWTNGKHTLLVVAAAIAMSAGGCASAADGNAESVRTQAEAMIGVARVGHANTVMLSFLCGDPSDGASADLKPCPGLAPGVAVAMGPNERYLLTAASVVQPMLAPTIAHAMRIHFYWNSQKDAPFASVPIGESGATVLIEPTIVGHADTDATAPRLAVISLPAPISQLHVENGPVVGLSRLRFGRGRVATEAAPSARPWRELVFGSKPAEGKLFADGVFHMSELGFASRSGAGALSAPVSFRDAASTSDSDVLEAFFEVEDRSQSCTGAVRGVGILEAGDVGGPVYEVEPVLGEMLLFGISTRAALVYGRATLNAQTYTQAAPFERNRELYRELQQSWPAFAGYLRETSNEPGFALNLYGGFEALRVDTKSNGYRWLSIMLPDAI